MPEVLDACGGVTRDKREGVCQLSSLISPSFCYLLNKAGPAPFSGALQLRISLRLTVRGASWLFCPNRKTVFLRRWCRTSILYTPPNSYPSSSLYVQVLTVRACHLYKLGYPIDLRAPVRDPISSFCLIKVCEQCLYSMRARPIIEYHLILVTFQSRQTAIRHPFAALVDMDWLSSIDPISSVDAQRSLVGLHRDARTAQDRRREGS